ncbi:cupin domain-containing protein [Actinopolymorpha singaporensis]|uniref:Cupin n=1 Tax=Actinopolymorpha singaporensis TaxID=117157 RepID=A0A1H1LEV6_9ACTN|nr:cupin domain-containing protein [Actinopolymorpha singaporensis]SDR72947.1 Cupin [Actinopolymorpha singaporensis]
MPSPAGVRRAVGAFPGGTAISRIRIYDWPTPDGLRGGSPHVHLLCTDGYIVLGGSGRLQTLGPDGYVEVPLRRGEIVWFTPGVIHRAVNDGDLDILVVMQNAGLPEAGDAVMTLPSELLADAERYAEATRLGWPAALDPRDEPAARARRDLAVEGSSRSGRGWRRRVRARWPTSTPPPGGSSRRGWTAGGSGGSGVRWPPRRSPGASSPRWPQVTSPTWVRAGSSASPYPPGRGTACVGAFRPMMPSPSVDSPLRRLRRTLPAFRPF